MCAEPVSDPAAVTVGMTGVRRVALMVVPLVLGIAPAVHGMWNCTTGGAVTNPAGNPGLVADCEALLAANRQWNGALNWSAQRAMTAWEGITMGGTPRRVTKLTFYEVELGGSIPRELGSLTKLTQLDLYNAELTGSIPRELGNLTNLTILRLQGNGLSGSIPRELGSLSNLRYLNLGYNELTGHIPWELRRLTKLERFGVHGNSLVRGSIPSWLGDRTNLTVLALHDSGLGGSMPRWLGNLTKLEQLYLSNLGLTGRVPSELRDFANLSILYLGGNNLTGCVPSSLERQLTTVAIGDLEYCNEPGKPGPPEQRAASGRTLSVRWSAPSNPGPAISGYDLEYRRQGSSEEYTLRSFSRATRSAIITGLATGTWYEVRVRAKNADGPGEWSDLLAALTSSPHVPRPDERAGGDGAERGYAEGAVERAKR